MTAAERARPVAKRGRFALSLDSASEDYVPGQKKRGTASDAKVAGERTAPERPEETARKDQVHLHALCWNERKMIPFFFRHYNDIVDRFFIYDAGSTDGSLELLQGDERVQVTQWSATGDSFLDDARSLANTVWKQSRDAAEWVLVVDMVEHLYHPDFRDHLRRCTNNGATAVKVIGYDMVAESFPTGDQPLWRLANRGIRFSDFDKLAIFDPAAVQETYYEVGRHASDPTGRVSWENRQPVKLLHYEHLGAGYVCERNDILRAALRPRDIAQGYGSHCRATRDEVAAQHAMLMRMAMPVPGLPGTAVLDSAHSIEQEVALIRASGLFQPGWYLSYYPDVSAAGKDPLEHFCQIGWREGRRPNSRFDPAWYMRAYGEAIGDVNPLLDYVVSGESLGRKPAPDFDPMEYRFRHGLAATASPLRHYLALRGDLMPGQNDLPDDFDPALYLEANPDVAKAGLDAAWHFLHHGKAEGRQLRPQSRG